MSNQDLVLQLIQLYRQQSFDSGSPPTQDQWDTLEAAAKDGGSVVFSEPKRVHINLGEVKGRWVGNTFIIESSARILPENAFCYEDE